MPTARLYFRNEDSTDLYLTVYDEYARKVVLDEEFLTVDATKDGDFEVGDGECLISWQCYRREEEDKTGEESEVEVSPNNTVAISTF